MIWFRDHVLPGLIVWALAGAWVWLSHRNLWKRIRALTAEQTGRFEAITERQTTALKNGDGEGGAT